MARAGIEPATPRFSVVIEGCGWSAVRVGLAALLTQPGGFEGFGRVHVPLNANDPPLTHVVDRRGIYHKLNPTPGALVFAVEDDHAVARVEELLWLDPRPGIEPVLWLSPLLDGR
jgi:hypothetical protein